MKKRIFLFASLLLGIFSALGQSSTEPTFVPFRPDMKSEFTSTFDLKKFKGNWVSLDGTHRITFYPYAKLIFVGGEYFPGLGLQGDSAIIRLIPYPTWQKKDPALRKLTIYYQISHSVGGGVSDIPMAYSLSTDHLIIGMPPYTTIENGQYTVHSGTYASNGIYGQEFKREPIINPTAPLHLDVIEVPPPGFEYPFCTYSKISGQKPIFISNVSGGAVMEINGVLVTLNFVKTGTDHYGKHYVTYTGGGVETTVKTGRDLTKGMIVVKNGYSKIQVPVIGRCSSAGAD